MSLDRLPGDEMQMTHEQIAIMLGVRRESVTQAALKLQMIGAIQYSRGHITVVDREELENSVCECYAVVNNEYDRLLWNEPDSYPARDLESGCASTSQTERRVVARKLRRAPDYSAKIRFALPQP